MSSHTVFIAHPTRDAGHAKTLAASLERAGVERFLALEQPPSGQRWPYEIPAKIEEAELFIALVSDPGQPTQGPSPDDGHYFEDEVATAIALYRTQGRPRIVPVYPSGRIPLRMPYGLRIMHGVSLADGDWDHLIRRLPLPLVIEASQVPDLASLRLQLECAHADSPVMKDLQERLIRQFEQRTEDDPLHGDVFAEDYRRLERTARDAISETWTSLDTTTRTFVSLRIYDAKHTHDKGARGRLKESTKQWAGYKHVAIPEVKVRWTEDKASGQFFITTELLGMTLEHAIEQRRVTSDELIDLLRPLAGALDHVTEDNTARRISGAESPLIRVNPQTIWLTADGKPKLTGFMPPGMTRKAFLENLEPAEHPYLAPEVVWQAEQPLTPAAGQFSLGMVALAVLDGVPLDVRALADRGRLLAELGCGRMVRQCLARATDLTPGRRYRSCREFVDDLENARILDTQEEVTHLLTSDHSISWLMSRTLRPIRCAGLVPAYVHQIPNASKHRQDLELEAHHVSAGDTMQSLEWEAEQTLAPLAQWLTNLRCLLTPASNLTRRLDSILGILAPQRRDTGLAGLLDADFCRLLDQLLGPEPETNRAILAELRADLPETISRTFADDIPDMPVRAQLFCDFVLLARGCGAPEGREHYLAWLQRVRNRAPGLAAWNRWLERAGAFQPTEVAQPEPRDRQGLRNAVAVAILGLGRYAEHRRATIDVLPYRFRAELELRPHDAAQVEADIDAIDALDKGHLSSILEAISASPRTPQMLRPEFEHLLNRSRAIPWDGEEGGTEWQGPEPMRGRAVPPAEPVDYWVLETSVLDLVLGEEVEWTRDDFMAGLSEWVVSWLPVKPQPKAQLMSDARGLFDLGRGAGMPLTCWLANILQVWEVSSPDSGDAPPAVVELRRVHAALEATAVPVGFALDGESRRRPAALTELMRPLESAGLIEVFAAAVEDGFFTRPNRAGLLLEDAASLAYRPVEQLRDELLALASHVSRPSSEPLQDWLERAGRLTASDRHREVYEQTLRQLRAP